MLTQQGGAVLQPLIVDDVISSISSLHDAQQADRVPHSPCNICFLSLRKWRVCVWRRKHSLVSPYSPSGVDNQARSGHSFAYLEGKAFRHGDIV